MAASFTLSPTSILEYTAGNVVTATGTATLWTIATTFSLAGGTGASITAQSVNAVAQTASLTITAGTASGTLTVSDSTDAATATLTVTAVTFAASPTHIPQAGTGLTVTLTGTNTSWTSGTTFSVSGGTGAAITNQSVNTGAQTASLTLAAGSATGTLTLSDGTDGATATLTVYGTTTPVAVANVPQFAPVSVSLTGANVLVNPVPGYMVVVLGYTLVPPVNTAVTVTWESAVTGAISGAMPIGGANNPPDLVAPDGPHGYLATVAGEGLNLNLGGAHLVTGSVTYWLAPAY